MDAILGNILSPQIARACDDRGCGHYKALRDQGKREHLGIDIRSNPGQVVLSPIEGIISKLGTAYAEDKRFKSVHIRGTGSYEGISVKLLYVSSNLSLNAEIQRGGVLGTAQNISQKYAGITNHVHLEVFNRGNRVDPTNKFGSISNTTDEPIELGVDSSGDGKSDVNVFSYQYAGADLISIDDLLLTEDFEKFNVNKFKLLKTEYEGKTNHKRIFDNLSIPERRKYNNGKTDYNRRANYYINSGTLLYVPIVHLQIEYTYLSNITSQKVNANEFFPAIIRNITNDPGYSPSYKSGVVDGKTIFPQITVKIWSRVKFLEGDEGDGFIDVTSDVIRCSTESGMSNGGNFSIELSSVIGVSQVNEKGSSVWQKTGSLGEGVDLGNLNREVDGEFIRNNCYYEKILCKNDLVFISFEKLNIDGSEVDKVAGRMYDMIGLIDTTSISSVAEINDINLTVRGRDLTKVLMDDNSYFNPYSVGHVNSIYGGQLGDRYLQGDFQNTAAFLARSIQDSIEFIFNRIASIGYVPDEVFYEFDNVTTNTIAKFVGNEENIDITVKGIWQIMKVFIDQSVADLRVVDDSVSNPNGSINDIINKIVQKPFAEFFCDTYGDKFYLIVRQPPFTQKAVSQAVWSIENADREADSAGVENDNQNTYNVKEKEFSEKDENQKSNLIIGNKKDTDNLHAKIVHILEEDAISDSLTMSNESYAWYKINDKGNFAGNTVNLGHVPALYFDEYAQTLGNKMLEITSNYSNFKFFDHEGKERDLDLYAEQAAQHLAYLVETNIHLPFTREGSIVINGDRRIKKGNYIYYKPTREVFYVREVHNSIQISKESNDRTTTIFVERGMVIDFINKSNQQIIDRNGNDRIAEVSYFNIVDIKKLEDGVYDIVTKGSADDKFDHKSSVQINEDVFNFFLQNRQFE